MSTPGKCAKLKCSEFSTEENREIKMQRKYSVVQQLKKSCGCKWRIVDRRQTVIVSGMSTTGSSPHSVHQVKQHPR